VLTTLRIAIDARDLLVPQRTGVERVVHHFIESLNRVGHAAHDYRLLFDRPPPEHITRGLPGETLVVPVRYPRAQKVADVWIAWQIPRVAREQGLDAVITPNTKFPFGSVARFTMVHGLEWWHCPRSYRATEWMKQCTWLLLATYFSSGVITFARATHRDIRRIRSLGEDSVCIVPEGVNPALRRLAPEERSTTTLERLGVERPFVLSVCSLEPRKNLERTIRAFSRLVEDGEFPHQLVLVGRAGWKSSKLAALTEERGLTDRVRLTGYVSDEDLLQLYNQADLFVYPSLYEGFGLPLLEAMACGVPIVSSKAGSLAEVAGDAAILVDPHSEEEIASGMSRGLADEALRGRLVEAGLERVRRFSWDEMARGICQFVDDRLRADR